MQNEKEIYPYLKTIYNTLERQDKEINMLRINVFLTSISVLILAIKAAFF